MLDFFFVALFGALLFAASVEDSKTRRVDIFVLLGMALVSGVGILGITPLDWAKRSLMASAVLLASLYYFVKYGSLQGDYIVYALLVWFLGGELGGLVVLLSGLFLLLFNLSRNEWKLSKKVFLMEEAAVPFIFLAYLPVVFYFFWIT